jgi:hypothetical protein
MLFFSKVFQFFNGQLHNYCVGNKKMRPFFERIIVIDKLYLVVVNPSHWKLSMQRLLSSVPYPAGNRVAQ